MAPDLRLIKFVNGQDADSATGPQVAAGSTLTFTYVVTNTGNVPLANVALTDDKLGPITSFTGDSNGNGLLDLGETWIYTATATAQSGQQTNTGTVTAQDATSPSTTVSDNNPANYFGDVTHVKETVTIARPVDFNADGNDDLLWRLGTDGAVVWTSINGAIAAPPVPFGSAPLSTTIEGTGDFNGDGRSDILFRNDDGHIVTWLMNNRQAPAIIDIGSAPATAHIAATGDFNGDGQTDILFRGDNGHVIEWLMTNGRVGAIQDIGSADASWNILGTGDLNGDGREDILFSNGDGHVTVAWFLNNAGQLASAQDIGHTPTGVQMGGSHFDLV